MYCFSSQPYQCCQSFRSSPYTHTTSYFDDRTLLILVQQCFVVVFIGTFVLKCNIGYHLSTCHYSASVFLFYFNSIFARLQVRPTGPLIPDGRRDTGSSSLATGEPVNDGDSRDEQLAHGEPAVEAGVMLDREGGGRVGGEAPTAASGVRQIVTVTAAHKRPRKLIKLIEKIEADAKTAGDRGGVTRVLVSARAHVSVSLARLQSATRLFYGFSFMAFLLGTRG